MRPFVLEMVSDQTTNGHRRYNVASTLSRWCRRRTGSIRDGVGAWLPESEMPVAVLLLSFIQRHFLRWTVAPAKPSVSLKRAVSSPFSVTGDQSVDPQAPP